MLLCPSQDTAALVKRLTVTDDAKIAKSQMQLAATVDMPRLLLLLVIAASRTATAQDTGVWTTLGGKGGVTCIHSALLPNGKILCFERPHEAPQYDWRHSWDEPNDPVYNYTGSEITLDLVNSQISFARKPLAYNAFCAGHAQAADGGIYVMGGDPRTNVFTTTNGTLQMDNGLQVKRKYTLQGDPDSASSTGVWQEGYLTQGAMLPEVAPTAADAAPNAPGIMATKRWYPTVVTLWDESAVIIAGMAENIDLGKSLNQNVDTNANNGNTIGANYAARVSNPTFEFHNVPAGDPRAGITYNSSFLAPLFPYNLYPFSFQLPNKKLFVAAKQWVGLLDLTGDYSTSGGIDKAIDVLSPLPLDTAATGNFPKHAPWNYPFSATAFLLPMSEAQNYSVTVMLCGGSKGDKYPANAPDLEESSSDCYAMKNPALGAPWVQMPNMPHARVMVDSVLLPDGTILITNGAGRGRAGGFAGQCVYAADPVFPTDLYNPATNSWSTVGTSTQVRLYHSGALLLPDASVVALGSEMNNYYDCFNKDGSRNQNLVPTNPNVCYPGRPDGDVGTLGVNCTDPFNYWLERFTPTYLSGSRPAILSHPTGPLAYGSTISIGIDPAVPISRVTLVRYGSTTHQVNTDQRLLEPTLICTNGTNAWFKIPPDSSIAPPGNYHLFVLSSSGTPSVAVRLSLRPSGKAYSNAPPTSCSNSGPLGTNSAGVNTTGKSSSSAARAVPVGIVRLVDVLVAAGVGAAVLAVFRLL